MRQLVVALTILILLGGCERGARDLYRDWLFANNDWTECLTAVDERVVSPGSCETLGKIAKEAKERWIKRLIAHPEEVGSR